MFTIINRDIFVKGPSGWAFFERHDRYANWIGELRVLVFVRKDSKKYCNNLNKYKNQRIKETKKLRN